MRQNKHLYPILLMAMVAIFYAPGLSAGAPRADQIALVSQWSTEPLWDLLQKFHSWNRIQYAENCVEISCPDLLLFRPLTYLVQIPLLKLAPTSFMLWQLLGIVIHGSTCLALTTMLKRLNNSHLALPSFLAIALFAVGFPAAELVYWSHLLGYLLFSLLLVLSLDKLIDGVIKDEPRLIMFSVLLAFISQFFYELGVLYLSLLSIFILAIGGKGGQVHGKRLQSALVAVSGVITYLVTNWVSILFYMNGSADTKSLDLSMTSTFSVRQLIAWVQQLLMPWRTDVEFSERTLLSAESYLVLLDASSWVTPMRSSVLLLVFGLVCALIVLKVRISDQYPPALLAISITAPLVVAYSVLISLGRSADRGLDYTLVGNVYYSYIANLLFLILFWCTTELFLGAIGRHLSVDVKRRSKLLAVPILISLVLVIALHSQRTWSLGRTLSQSLSARESLIRTISTWEEDKKEQEGFFLMKGDLDETCPGDKRVDWMGSGHFTNGRGWSSPSLLSDALFPDKSARLNTRNSLHWSDSRVDIIDCPP